MTRLLPLGTVCLLGSLLQLPAAQAEGTPGIRIDPFEKPAELRDAHNGLAAHGGGNPQPSWTPVLTATMRSGDRSLVNVGGRIVGLGEDIDGYRLIKVLRDSAVFEKNRQKTILTMDEFAAEETD